MGCVIPNTNTNSYNLKQEEVQVLYAANQESTDLINEAHMEDVPLRFMGQDVLYFQPLSLD